MRNLVPRIRLVRSFVKLLRDPEETEQVFRIIESLDADPKLRRRFPFSREIQRFVDAPFTQDFPDLDAMARLPEATMGRALARHMTALGVDFSQFDRSHDLESELDRLSRHAEETHDLWHVVTGFGTDVFGEVGLQAFYLAQTNGLPPLVLLTLGMSRLFIDGHAAVDPMMDAITRGWQMGRRARPLMGVDWRPYLDRPLVDIRAEFDVDAIRLGERSEPRSSAELAA